MKLHLYFCKTHTILQDFGIYNFGLQCQISEGHCFFNSTIFPCLNFAYSFAEDSIMVEFMSVENILKAKKNCVLFQVQQQGATVMDLKHAIRRYFTLKLTRYQQSSVKISWRYIWHTNWLVHEGCKLKDDNALLADIGIRNKSRVSFIKRLRQRGESR